MKKKEMEGSTTADKGAKSLKTKTSKTKLRDSESESVHINSFDHV